MVRCAIFLQEARPPARSLDFSARTWIALLLIVLFVDFSDSRASGSQWPSACRFLPSRSRQSFRPSSFLVRADAALVEQQFSCAVGVVLDWNDCRAFSYVEYLAARDAFRLLCRLSLFCFRGARFFRLPIRWHVA